MIKILMVLLLTGCSTFTTCDQIKVIEDRQRCYQDLEKLRERPIGGFHERR